jgi:predicted  nucleic acid-binding Zn-ribbon protein
LSEERRAELERLRQKEVEKEKQIKRNEEEINSLKSKLNDPNTSPEEKDKLKKRIAILDDDNKKLKGELTSIRTQITTKENETPPTPTAPSTP